MQKSHKYDITQFKTLVDLNEGLQLFELSYNISSTNGKPFKMVIVSESTLNSGKPLEYKDVIDGQIEGKVFNDNPRINETYFAVLQSDEPTECEVNTVIQEIKPTQELIQPRQQRELEHSSCKDQFNWPLILCFIAIIAIIIWYLFYFKTSKTKTPTQNNETAIEIKTADVSPKLVPEILSVDNGSILNKLNKYFDE